MICPRPALITSKRAKLNRERQRVQCELLAVNHRIGLEAQRLGLTMKQALALAKEEM